MSHVTYTILLLVLVASNVHAQDYGVTDTIWVDDDSSIASPVYLRAYGDTVVLATSGQLDGTNLWFSDDRGNHWQSQKLKGYPQGFMPGVGVHSGGVTLIEGIGQHVWLYRGNELVYSDTVGKSGDMPPYTVRRIYIHPLRPEIAFLKCEVPVFQSYFSEPTYIRFSDSESWIPFKIPRSNFAGGYATTIEFDYSRTDRIWVSVNGSDYFNRDLPNENYYTDDYGITFHAVEVMASDTLPKIIGMWREDFGVQQTLAYIHGDTRYNLLYLYNPLTRESDTLDWQASIIRDLLPQYDGRNEYVTFPTIGDDYAYISHSSRQYNPLLRQQIATSIYIDTLVDGEWQYRVAKVVTTDFGKTWAWLIRPYDPNRVKNYQHGTVDPVNRTYYLEFLTYDSTLANPSRTPIRRGVIRITPTSTTVSDKNLSTHGLRVTPHPVSESATVSTARDEFIQDVIVHDLAGQPLLTQHCPEPNNVVTLNTSSFAIGMYVISVQTNRGIRHTPLVVHR